MHVERSCVERSVSFRLSAVCLCAFAFLVSDKGVSQTAQLAPSSIQASPVWDQAGLAGPGDITHASACGEDLAQFGALDVQLGAEPGATDPMGRPAGRYQLFPDQGLASYISNGSAVQLNYFTTDKDASLSLKSSQTLKEYPLDPYGSGPVQVFGTAGRILRPDRDSLVTATRMGNATANGTKVAINFLDEGFSTTLEEPLLPRQRDSSDFLAIAHGDLDNAADAEGNYHDEVVVARVTGEGTSDKHYYRYAIDVLNYGSGSASSPKITSTSFVKVAPHLNYDPNSSTSGVLPSDNILSVAIGDFAGDGHKEIAFLALGDQTLLLYTYRYEVVGNEPRLVQVGSQFFLFPSSVVSGPMGSQQLVGTIAATNGNFAGSGKDELAIAYATWGPSASNPTQGYGKGVLLLGYDAQFKAKITSTNYVDLDSQKGGKHLYFYESRPRVQLVVGQFLLQPPAIKYGRPQMVLGWNDSHFTVNLRALSVSDDAKTITSFGGTLIPQRAGQAFALAAGGYAGIAGTAPLASLAMSNWDAEFGLTFLYERTLRVTSNGISIADVKENFVHHSTIIDYRARFPLIAYDRPGNSRYLGPPAHITLLNAPQTEYVMQEPPKHAYWDENARAVVNFTRFDKNNVHLYNASSASLSTSSTDESAWTIGGSVAATAGATGNAGGNWGILKADVTTTLDVGLSASYDYSAHEEQYNSDYKERTITSTGQTDRDDYLKGSLQTTDIWRYRVYGTPTGGGLNGFYELVLPGPRVNFAGGGLNFDWYQPRHENGNILSYEAALGPPSNPLIPTDIGSYVLPNGKTLQTPQIPAQLQFFDGSSGTTELRYSEEVAAAGSFTSSHEIAESADIKVSYTAKVETPFGGGETRFCGSAEAHNSNSWGGTKTSTEVTKEETAITLNKSAGQSTTAYPFFPVVYTTKDGTLKLSFSAPNPADRSINPAGASKFASLYGTLPDPAVNLPSRMVPDAAGSGELERWIPTTTNIRKKMRGLFFRQAAIDPVSNTYPLLGLNPSEGQTVRIEPRVYNYSTGQAAVGTVVEFQVIPYDDANDSEVCPSNSGPSAPGSVCPRSERVTIGKATIPRLEPRQFTCVSGFDDPAVTGCAPSTFLNWNTSGYAASGASKEYRVYVVLNPNGEGGPEIYGLEPRPVQITGVKNATPIVVTAPGTTLETGDYVTISGVQGVNAANGTFQVTLISDDEFSLNNTVLTRGSYEGGGSAQFLDPGQNNEGYGYITVARAANAASLTKKELAPEDYLGPDALEALTEKGTASLQQTSMTAALNVPLQLRFTAHSNAAHNDAAHMLFFDGDPTTGAPAVADKIIHPGSHGRKGTSVWFTWTPTTMGTHHLYAVLLEGSGTRQSSGELEVDVVANPQ